MSFDRLVYIDRLKGAGIDDSVARAHADALREALVETVATKADLSEAVSRLDRRIDELRTELSGKIEITARDLTMRGAGGLVILAGIIFGLKLFG